jgi:cobalt/nickel transport system permease protein
MLSRGFDGELPHTEAKSVGARAWLIALTIPTLALITSIAFKVNG